MSITPAIEKLAVSSVLLDPEDMPALVDLHDRVKAVIPDLASADLDPVVDCLEQTTTLLQQLVYREATDIAASLDLIRRAIEYARRAVEADEAGRTLAEVGPSPFAATPQSGAPETADKDLVEWWIAECNAGLAELEGLVVALESGADADPDAIGSIRRRLHTLKGECGVLSLREAQRLCHAAESAIDSCIERAEPIPATALLSLVDWMRTYTAALSVDASAAAPDPEPLLAIFTPSDADATQAHTSMRSEAAEAPASGLRVEAPSDPASDAPVELRVDPSMRDSAAEFLGEAREHLAGSEAALLELEKTPANKELINTVFRAFHTIKGVAGFLSLTPIATLAHSTEFLLDAARSDRLVLASGHLNLVLRSCDVMAQMLRTLETGSGGPPAGAVSVLVADLERATRGEPPAESAGEPAPIARTSEPAPEPAAVGVPASPPPPGSAQVRSDQTVKVSTARLDALVDMVGELVIAQQMIVQDPAVRAIRDQRVNRNFAMVGKIIRDLQEVSMSLRMVPVKATFQKMARLVRDVSTKAGKRITLHTEGEDVELDRTVVEVIADPLVHMIRNACDHGIEPADARRAAGKDECGSIWLRAFHSGGSILIEIQDDGKGLDRERILKKAVEKGIYTPDRPAAEIPDAEVYALVFLPGFSTAEKVTDLSGRGVGMDVVRRNIEGLRGKVDITSVPGHGTRFTMKLPLTLAIIDGMVVRLGDERFVIPTLSIERTFRARPGDVSTVVGRGRVVRVRDHLLPVFRLGEALGGRGDTTAGRDELLVVVENQGTRACLAVDEILGQQQVVIKNLGEGTEPIRGVSGGAILGDGRVALILDIGGLLNAAVSSTV